MRIPFSHVVEKRLAPWYTHSFRFPYSGKYAKDYSYGGNEKTQLSHNYFFNAFNLLIIPTNYSIFFDIFRKMKLRFNSITTKKPQQVG